MSGYDLFETDLRTWFDASAEGPIPSEARTGAFAAIAGRRPRPGRLAGFGSHWVADRPGGSAALTWHAVRPGLGSAWAILVLLLAIALIGAALLVGSTLRESPTVPGRLVYRLDGAIFLTDADGGNPKRVAPDAASAGSGTRYDLNAPGSIWSPDGRHFVFIESGPEAVAHIGDAEGRRVATLADPPGFDGYPLWSPDSTRLHAWTADGIAVFGLDGAVQVTLSMPDGYARLDPEIGSWAPDRRSVWGPDGRSVWVWVQRPQTYPCNVPPSPMLSFPGDCHVPEAWALPIDGSPPHRVAQDLRLVMLDPTFAPDATRMAFSGLGNPMFEPGANDWLVYVADADGTDRTPIVNADQDPNAGKGFHPIWSPRGDQIAYLWSLGGGEPWDYVAWPRTVDLRVVDLATGVTQSLGELDRASQVFGWSSSGDALLYRRLGDDGDVSLWRVASTGGPPTVLVQGASAGAWQPTPSR